MIRITRVLVVATNIVFEIDSYVSQYKYFLHSDIKATVPTLFFSTSIDDVFLW